LGDIFGFRPAILGDCAFADDLDGDGSDIFFPKKTGDVRRRGLCIVPSFHLLL
jgi:hypothetical protein